MGNKIDKFSKEQLRENLLKYNSAIEAVEMIREEGEELTSALARFKYKLNERRINTRTARKQLF